MHLLQTPPASPAGGVLLYDGVMAWDIAQLREYRQLPQSDEVLTRALSLAQADVDNLKFESLPDERAGIGRSQNW